MRTSELYSIGDMSKMCHVSIKTLRYYDAIGLLPAYQKNSETNYRYYTNEQIIRLFFIQNMKSLGFSLDEIKKIDFSGDGGTFAQSIENKIADIQKNIVQLENQREFLSSFFERINSYKSLMELADSDEQNSLLMNVEVIPEGQVAFLSQTKKNYVNHEINIEARRDLLTLARKAKIIPSGPFTATYHNAPLEQFFSNVCDYEISVPFIGESDNRFCKKSGGYQALTCIYVGRYQNIIHAHIEMLRWIKENRYYVSGNISETFLITPIDTGNADAFVTKIIIPILPLS